MKLAVIDNHPPTWAATLVPFLDMLGYSRYWTTEQHLPHQSGSPILTAALAGARCKRMRIGTAGVMLRVNGLHRVLADFKVLQFFYRGRVDMGFVPNAVPEPLHSRLADHPCNGSPDDFSDRLRRLVALVRGENPDADDHVDARSLTATELWLCGSSARSAQLAAELGICYAYHDKGFVAGPGTGPRIAALVGTRSTEPARIYLDEFRPAPGMPAPRLSLACYGICAQTTAEAQQIWERNAGCDNKGVRWRAGFCGDPDACREQLLAMQEAYGAHEIALQTVNRDLTGCLSAYSLLAAGCLARAEDAPAPVDRLSAGTATIGAVSAPPGKVRAAVAIAGEPPCGGRIS
jgi:alkanesulfonate monooxygenase SsuD/methylene tetrahydromethanopterin reductase-like flavin-dependent oxidoreductase (luciferase family)